jgi:pyrimidine deaminase RibD-like protein
VSTTKNAGINWMKRALAIAREAEAAPGKNPIGCVNVENGRIIGEACNEVDLRHDATAHAEILVIGRAGEKLKCNELREAVLYPPSRAGCAPWPPSGPRSAASSTVPVVMMCTKLATRRR